MKTINKTSLLLALIILAIAFSIISMIAAPAEIRYSWHGLNPWNTIQAVPLMFKRFLKMDDWIISILSLVLNLVLTGFFVVAVKRISQSVYGVKE